MVTALQGYPLYPDRNISQFLSLFQDGCKDISTEDVIILLDDIKENLPGKYDYTLLHFLYQYTVIRNFPTFFKSRVAIVRNTSIQVMLYNFLSRYKFVKRKNRLVFVPNDTATLNKIKKDYLDGVVSLKCPFCSRRFSYWSSFIRHYRTIHKDEYQIYGDIRNLCKEKAKMIKQELTRFVLRTKRYDIQTLLIYLKTTKKDSFAV